VSNDLRSRTMRAVKSVNTSSELTVRKLLCSSGYRYRLHRRDLPGVPDIVFPSRRKCVFVHGCFWHQHHCSRGNRQPKSNSSYWSAKLLRNQERDIAHLGELARAGWNTLVVWECELKDERAILRKLRRFLDD